MESDERASEGYAPRRHRSISGCVHRQRIRAEGSVLEFRTSTSGMTLVWNDGRPRLRPVGHGARVNSRGACTAGWCCISMGREVPCLVTRRLPHPRQLK